MSIIVIGDIMLDINHTGISTKLAQEACLPVINVDTSQTLYQLGGASNVYNNLVSMNCDVRIISVCGCDSNGSILRSMLIEKNSDNCIIADSTRLTTTKNRFYVNKKLVFRYDTEDTFDIQENVEKQIIDEFKRQMNSCRFLIMSDYNKGVLTPRLTQTLIQLSNANNIKVFVDPKFRNVAQYRGCFLIKPNQVEGENICGYKITKSNADVGAYTIMKTLQTNACLLTLGENGMVLYSDNAHISLKATANQVIDITGAGDVVLSSFIYYYQKTNNLEESAKFSNYCGQLKVKNLGTYTVTPYDVITYERTLNKVVTQSELLNITNIVKSTSRKVVLTNGCFDILHVGHLNFLEHAKECGDVLIVAINSDASVKMNKGESRPINDINYRCKQMSMISCVDYVVVFEEKTPYKILELIRPDILVKGGDYNLDQIIGREFAKETLVIEYIEGFSSTSIIKKLTN